jgi:ribosomal protein S18 acetylase RimI-like enzyme
MAKRSIGSIRPAQPADVPHLIPMLLGQTPWAELGYDLGRCTALLADHLDEIQVGVSAEGTPAGFLRWQAGAFLGQPYLQLLAVAPRWRGQGVGSALLEWLETEVFERRRAANLFAFVSAFNQPARGLYQRRGYVEVGVMSDYLRLGMDEILVRKSVRPLLSEEV